MSAPPSDPRWPTWPDPNTPDPCASEPRRTTPAVARPAPRPVTPPAPLPRRPGISSLTAAQRRRPFRRGRIRGGIAHRFLLHAAIPLAALAVLAWGVFADVDPPPTSDAALVAPPVPTTPATPPPTATPLPMRAITWPQPVGGAASPVASLGSMTPSPTSAPATATPRPTPTTAPSPTPTAPAASDDCRSPAPLPSQDDGPVETTAPVNLRSGPGTGCSVLEVLPAGTEAIPRGAPVSADGRLWLPIEVNGSSGWAATDFLQDAEP